jgi:hypothetical protein
VSIAGHFWIVLRLRSIKHLLDTLLSLLLDIMQFLFLTPRSGTELRAENLFLWDQVAFYAEKKIKPKRVNDGARIFFVPCSAKLYPN